MNVCKHTFGDENPLGDVRQSPCTGLTPDVLPEVQKSSKAENSQTGVTTRNALSGIDGQDKTYFGGVSDSGLTEDTCTPGIIKRKPKDEPHWYALRVTYGREKKVYDYLVGHHVEAYYPTIKTVKIVRGKRKSVIVSRLPNIFFARGTEEELKSFVYDNVNLPHLRFYYRHFHQGAHIFKTPLIVPDSQMESLKIICASEAEDVIVSGTIIQKFQTGMLVRIEGGTFKGVVGRVARYQGQMRVAVIIEHFLTVATAYVPACFLKPVQE